jgi:hypothetical protein
MWTPKWIPRDPRRVVDEIEGYARALGVRNFPFQDLTAIIRKDWIVSFCRELLSRNLDITWQLPSGTRSEAIDDEVAALLKESGMINMSYAPESGSDETRKLVKKRMKADRLFESIRAAVDAGLNVSCFLVVGFPHDTEADMAANLPFVDRLAEVGVADCSCGFYMALPGTELFDSLYEAGKIRLDRPYFRHILSSLQLVATQSYCEALGVWGLTKWKGRILKRFYGHCSRRAHRPGLRYSLARGFSGLSGRRNHSSKLQSAFRNAVSSLRGTISSRTRPGWLSRSQERKLFAGWDDAYRHVRRQRRTEEGIKPALRDPRQLHRASVVPALKLKHEQQRVVSVGSISNGSP